MLTFKPPGVWSWFGLWKDYLLLQIVNSLTTWGLSPPRAGSQRTFPPAGLSQRHPWPSSDVQPSKSQFQPSWKEEIWLQWKKIGLDAWIGGSVGAGVVGVGVEGTEKRQKWPTMKERKKQVLEEQNSHLLEELWLALCQVQDWPCSVCLWISYDTIAKKCCCVNDTDYDGANNSVSSCNLQGQADDKKLMPSNPMSASKPPLMWPRKWKL